MSDDLSETSMYLGTKHRWNCFQNRPM